MLQVFLSTVTSLAAAELLLILMRTREIIIISKAPHQRTSEEQFQVERGLKRQVALEILLFVPVSVFFMSLFMRNVLAELAAFKVLHTAHPVSFDAMIGSISYGFPFAGIRQWIVGMAIRGLEDILTASREKKKIQSNRAGRSGQQDGGRS
jgi:hypothetical protein